MKVPVPSLGTTPTQYWTHAASVQLYTTHQHLITTVTSLPPSHSCSDPTQRDPCGCGAPEAASAPRVGRNTTLDITKHASLMHSRGCASSLTDILTSLLSHPSHHAHQTKEGVIKHTTLDPRLALPPNSDSHQHMRAPTGSEARWRHVQEISRLANKDE